MGPTGTGRDAPDQPVADRTAGCPVVSDYLAAVGFSGPSDGSPEVGGGDRPVGDRAVRERGECPAGRDVDAGPWCGRRSASVRPVLVRPVPVQGGDRGRRGPATPAVLRSAALHFGAAPAADRDAARRGAVLRDRGVREAPTDSRRDPGARRRTVCGPGVR
ncbi:hypothetical protein GP2_017_00520 [Gordonia paraffinivorans NBRC 108238]|uniref:Uncharacterized protein n=1 Tax=Gordonia paraffinivorans NBRC 108238 TaxID=1223543 RepID=A0ABQ0IKE1_9ACTN|nr:hypothetical protein GP2_017_00520 [Gordonia paraffinivorans NBRC 108238]